MTKINFHKLLLMILIIISFFVYVHQAYINIDPDFGWHIKLGEIVLNEGVPMSDPFSYTMPSFPFIDHEWLTNIFLYKSYESIGRIGLSVVYATLTFLAFWISLARQNIKFGSSVQVQLFLFLFLLVVGVSPSYFGIRPQIQSWFLFSLFLVFVFNEKYFNKYFYIIPLLQIFWVNTHGSFPVPIITLLLVSVVKSLRLKKIWILGFATIILSVLATAINPYGLRIWHEVFQQVTDSAVRWVLVEWKPVFYSFNIFYLVFVAIYVVTLKKYFQTFKPELVIVNLFFFLQSIASVRHIPLWLLINLPMAYKVLADFYLDIKKVKFGQVRFLKLLYGANIVTLLFLMFTLYPSVTDPNKALSEENFYPRDAITYLRGNPGSGNVFSEYGWGGYLIWKYPEKKVFVDGRMATWKWGADITDESNYIMGEYLDIIKAETDIGSNFAKYNIDTILWPNKLIASPTYRLEKYIRNTVFGEIYNDDFNMHVYLLNQGWDLVYNDEVSSIYRKEH